MGKGETAYIIKKDSYKNMYKFLNKNFEINDFNCNNIKGVIFRRNNIEKLTVNCKNFFNWEYENSKPKKSTNDLYLYKRKDKKYKEYNDLIDKVHDKEINITTGSFANSENINQINILTPISNLITKHNFIKYSLILVKTETNKLHFFFIDKVDDLDKFKRENNIEFNENNEPESEEPKNNGQDLEDDSNNKSDLIKLKEIKDFKSENIIFYGVPGCGKSHYIKNEYIKYTSGINNGKSAYAGLESNGQIMRTVFHPDYTYSDFVGQILPQTDNSGQVTYEFKPGPFTKILKEAYENPDYAYYLIIEEINRGNAPAIFGDIFQLLDRIDDEQNLNYGESEYSIENEDVAKSILYINNEENEKLNKREDKEKIKKELEKNQIKIPANLTLAATMNTSDQNVFTLDTAFQRRWKMRMILNSEPKNGFVPGTEVKWAEFWKTINSKIAESNNIMSAEDKRLGTYFVKESDLSKFINDTDENKIRDFAEKVFKYLWDDAFKMNRKDIFKDDINTLEDIISKCNTKILLDEIFKDELVNKFTQNSAQTLQTNNQSAQTIGQAIQTENKSAEQMIGNNENTNSETEINVDEKTESKEQDNPAE